jgi:hydroxymethylpyrimidine/phosphomethylpyrimidine kinase
MEDYDVAAVKTGMLGNAANVHAIADVLETYGGSLPLVVDPVIRSSSGAELLTPDGAVVLAERLVPLATVVAPNFDEAATLLGWDRVGPVRAQDAAEALGKLGPMAAVVTGGHGRPGQPAVDRVFVADGLEPGQGPVSFDLASPWVDTSNTHGTGCLFTAGVCSALALGRSLETALQHGKSCVASGLRGALSLGVGRGPVWMAELPSL